MGAAPLRAFGAALAMLLLAATACGQSTPAANGPVRGSSPPPDAGPVATGGLPGLPQDAGAFGPARATRATAVQDGVARFMDSGSGVTVNANNGLWLELDATTAESYAWGVWRLPISPNGDFERIQLSCGPGMKYYVLYADYARGRWSVYQYAATPAGRSGSFDFDPRLLPGGVAALSSPGGYTYIGVLAAAENTGKLQVKTVGCTYPDVVDPDPIFDDFEDNDTLEDATQLGAGMYHASIHQTPIVEMLDTGELTDYFDCYRVTVPAGKVLTATLRHAVFDPIGPGFENDADLLFYYPGATQIMNDFDEGLSSTGIWYDPFEQVNFNGGDGRDYYLVVLGDSSEPGAPTNCEYDLGIFLSDAVYSVSGTITQDDLQLDKEVVVFLEPGNFNAATPLPGNGAPGAFSIQGVPAGGYTLRVHGSGREQDTTGHVWDESLGVVVAGGVSGLTLDLGPDPG